MTIGIDLDIATAGGQVAGQPHPDTGFCAHQFDGAGVHATQRGGVDGQLWLGAAVVRTRRGIEGLCVNVVAARDQGQVAGVDLRIEPGRAGDDLEAVDVAGIQPRPLDAHAAAIDLKVIEASVVQDRGAGGEGGTWGVDEAAAVATDAIGVGDDDARRWPRDFGVPAQVARITAVDFIENGAGRRALKVRVAENDPAQLRGLGARRGVVEDHPVGADVVVAELIVRQATGIGRGDVDDGHAIAGLAQ